MKTQTKINLDNMTESQINLTLINGSELNTDKKNKILSRIFGAIVNVFKTDDLNYESWERLESHKYCRPHSQDSYQLRFYV